MDLKSLLNLVESKDYVEIKAEISNLQEADVAELLDELDVREAVILYRMIPKEMAAEVFSFLDVEKQAEISLLVSDEELNQIVDELYFDDKIDLIEEMPAGVVKKILKNSTVVERRLINQFLKYEEDTAGSIMTIEFVHLRANMTVAEAMAHIKRTGVSKETIYTCYVTDEKRELTGVVTLKELVLADDNLIISGLMEQELIYVQTHDDQEIIANIFKKYDFLSLPVVDNEARIVGIITIDDVVDVIEEETTEDFQKMAAINPSDEEYMDVRSFDLAKRRVVWLAILMFSATISEYIMKSNGYLTSQFIILGAMVPMLMSTGGNAGAQSSTLVIRGLTLGEIGFEDIYSVIWKEIKVGLIIGGTLGVLNFLRILITSQDIHLAFIVGLTLIGTSVTATSMGSMLPILAKKAGLDPATMASPLITTITDALTLIIFFAISATILI